MFLSVSFCFMIINCIESIASVFNETTTKNNGSKVSGICHFKNCQSLCLSPKIDAILNYQNGTIYAFKGNFFYEIMNKSVSMDDSNRRIISKYWNPLQNGIFTGPIDAAFIDDNNFTYLFKNNIIHTFLDFKFIETQTIKTFNRVNSALSVNFKQSRSYVYIFTGIYYWKIYPIDTKYNWTDMFLTFHKREIKRFGPKFPKDFDVIFQDNQKDIRIITEMKYKTIPIEKFPSSITDEDINEKFVYKDLFNCEQDFYKTTKYLNYDQFIIDLLTNKGNGQQNCRNLIERTQNDQNDQNEGLLENNEKYDKSTVNWLSIIIWSVIASVVLILITYLIKRLMKRKTWKNKRQCLRTTLTKNNAIDLIRQKDLISEDI